MQGTGTYTEPAVAIPEAAQLEKILEMTIGT